ncbi:L-lysine 6-monooxygenase (NADPH-requiring)-domain-containing protein [Mucidula mucida]|nr:L-lysine 6-monooxygenase (NADPH-requiring)-domain-containing protein [Mucidula mucida]
MSSSDSIFDLIGLGFGPANIAIAGAIVETRLVRKADSCPLNQILFIEKHAKFSWHPGMLLPDAKMQISFMKDLATLRSPQSPITFFTIPTRKEYADYLSWAAQWVQDHGIPVSFATEVVAIDTDADGIVIVRSKNLTTGEITSRRTRNLIISPGGTGRVPHPMSTVVDHPLIIHSASFLTSIDSIMSTITAKGKDNLRIAVIGSGQSAAEVTLNLRERLAAIPAKGAPHSINMVIRKGALRPSDDTGFANEIFDPSATNDWYSLSSPNTRQMRLREYKSTNYSVVNPITLEALYEVIYGQKVDKDIAKRTGVPSDFITPLINIETYSHILARLYLHHPNIISRAISTEKYDAVICATGYQRTLWVDLLKESSVGKAFGLSPACHPETCRLAPENENTRDTVSSFDESTTPSSHSSSNISTPPTSPSLSATQLDHPHKIFITRGYRLLPSEGQTLKSRIYLQGVEEATHGLSDTLLSILGIRAGEVVDDLCKLD